MIDWAAVERAVRAWVKTSSGYDDAHVVWSKQDGPRPSRPFVELNFLSLIDVGQDATNWYTDLGRPAGEEVELRLQGLRSAVFRVQVYTADATGASSARALAEQIRSKVNLPSILSALVSAGVAPYDQGIVRDLSGVLEAKQEGRAVFDASFYVKQEISEFTGYIAAGTVTITTDTGLDPVTVEVDAS